MTKKELSAIRHAAYLTWCETEDAKELLKTSYEHFRCWRIIEGEKRTLFHTVFNTQVNKETIRNMGFSDNAAISLLFEVDRKTKTLTPAGTWFC